MEASRGARQHATRYERVRRPGADVARPHDVTHELPVDVSRLRIGTQQRWVHQHDAVCGGSPERGAPAVGPTTRQGRAERWLMLLNVPAKEVQPHGLMQTTSPEPDRQVLLDVPRSLHFDVCQRWSASERAHACEALTHVLARVFPAAPRHAGEVAVTEAPRASYYQGCHDIASVLLLATNAAHASTLMQALVRTHLQGFVGESVHAAMLCTRLVSWLIEAENSALDAHLEAAGVKEHTHVYVSWILTWFAHNIPNLATLFRLFEAFMGAHPLFATYVAAAVVVHHAPLLRVLPASFEALYPALSALPTRMRRGGAEVVLASACEMYRRTPPAALLMAALRADERRTLREAWPALDAFPALYGDVILGKRPSWLHSYVVCSRADSRGPAVQVVALVALAGIVSAVAIQWWLSRPTP